MQRTGARPDLVGRNAVFCRLLLEEYSKIHSRTTPTYCWSTLLKLIRLFCVLVTGKGFDCTHSDAEVTKRWGFMNLIWPVFLSTYQPVGSCTSSRYRDCYGQPEEFYDLVEEAEVREVVDVFCNLENTWVLHG